MINFTKATLLVLVGITLVVLLSAEARPQGVNGDEENTRLFKSQHGVGDMNQHELSSRAADDVTEHPHKKKSKKSKNHGTTAAPSSANSTTSAKPGKTGAPSGTTTGKPMSTTSKPDAKNHSTTAKAATDSKSTVSPTKGSAKATTSKATAGTSTSKPSSGNSTTTAKPNADALDDYYMEKLVKDRQIEKAIIVKLHDAMKEWTSFLESHDKKTLNNHRSNAFWSDVSEARRNYFVKRPRNDAMRSPYVYNRHGQVALLKARGDISR